MTFFDFMDKHFDAIANGCTMFVSLFCFILTYYITSKMTK